MKKITFYLSAIFLISCNCKKINNQADTLNCVEITEEKYNGETFENVLITKCYYKNYLFKSIGIPDYSERYSYDYFVYEIYNNDTIQIKNTDVFNKDFKKLEKTINQRLKSSLHLAAKHEELKRCLGLIEFRYYDFNEFGISFTNNDIIQFNINYGISMACAPVSNGLVQFKLNELQPYLK